MAVRVAVEVRLRSGASYLLPARERLRVAAPGRVFIDDEVLAEAGATDFNRYTASSGAELAIDLYVDGWLDVR